jgi:putative nucleotidyltransferase with HDIG domain
MQKFWEHSVGCAVAAKVLAETAHLPNPDDIFAGGLLHDIGKLIHAIYLDEAFNAVIADVQESGLSMCESEEKILGYDHTYTGRELAARWSLPQGTIAMISQHHLRDASARLTKEVAAVHIGDIICIALGLGSGGEKKVPVANTKAWEILGIDLGNLEYIIARIEKLFKESVSILKA